MAVLAEAVALMAGQKEPRRTSRQDDWSMVRLRPDLHERLRTEARARDLSVTYLLNRAVEDLLERLVPVDEWKLTRDP